MGVMNRRGWITTLTLVLIFGCAAIIFWSQKPDVSEPTNDRAFKSSYAIMQVPLPKELSLAGQRIPIETWYVRESLERELLVNVYWQSNTLLMIKRASRWMPEIKQIFKGMGVPEELAYLSLVESALTGAVSPAGAEGYWQFLESTGRSYGLEINSEVDERYHLTKSSRAAAKYLLDAKAKFGDWLLAAAAYNRGMDGLSKAIDNQKEKGFFDLWLNAETTRYIYRLLAIKLIVENPAEYGFRLRAMDLYPPLDCDTVTVDTSISDLPSFAHQLGISFRTLKELNPWLQRYTLTVKSGSYQILIPKDGKITYPNSWFDEPNRHYIGIDNE